MQGSGRTYTRSLVLKVLSYKYPTWILQEIDPILGRYRLKYLGITHADVCNLLSDGSGKKKCVCMYVFEERERERECSYGNVNNLFL